MRSSMRKAFSRAAATSILNDMDSMGSLTRRPLLRADMPVLAAEALRGFFREMLRLALTHWALEEHESLEDVVGQAQSWRDRGVLFADASEDCQDDHFDDEENEGDDEEEQHPTTCK
eukprot:3999247-Amphidinium_carterae.2